MPTSREDIERDLDEFIEGETWPEATPEDPEVPIPAGDLKQVSGVLRRLKRLDREKTELLEVRDAEIRRITAFYEDRTAGIDREIAWGERSVQAFMIEYSRASHKKSLRLHDGTPKLSAGRAKVVVVDEKALLEFVFGAEDGKVKVFPELPDKTMAVDFDPADPTAVPTHPQLVRAKYSLIADAVKELKSFEPEGRSVDEPLKVEHVALPDGTIIPGVEIQTPKADTFSITLGSD